MKGAGESKVGESLRFIADYRIVNNEHAQHIEGVRGTGPRWVLGSALVLAVPEGSGKDHHPDISKVCYLRCTKTADRNRLTLARKLGGGHLLGLAFSWEFVCSDHPMCSPPVSAFGRPALQAPPELVGLSRWYFFVHRPWGVKYFENLQAVPRLIQSLGLVSPSAQGRIQLGPEVHSS